MTSEQPASGTPRPDQHSSVLRRKAILGRGPVAAMALLLTTAVATAACSPAASGAPSAPPSGTPTATPAPTPTAAPVGLEHPMGPGDVVFRIEESGGFVPVEFNMTYAPNFTLYGDGTVVFRDPTAIPPEPVGNVTRLLPFQTVKLDEAGVQAFLERVLGPGGLGAALGPYTCNCADLPSTTFTINADGKTKQVSVTGLSPDQHPQNGQIVAALSRLAESLQKFGAEVGTERPYQPAGYRGVLFPVDQPFGPVIAWPWADISPDQFVGPADALFKTRALSAEEVASLGIPDATNGIQGVALQKDGKLYTFALRPLLPDESS